MDVLCAYQMLLDFEQAYGNSQYSFEVGTTCCLLSYLLKCLYSVSISMVKSKFYRLIKFVLLYFPTTVPGEEEDWALTNMFNPVIYFLCLSQARNLQFSCGGFLCSLLFVLRFFL